MAGPAPLSLAEGLALSGLSAAELWRRCHGIGGVGDLAEVREHLGAHTCPDDAEHNVIAQALNDVFVERGMDHPVAYRHLEEH